MDIESVLIRVFIWEFTFDVNCDTLGGNSSSGFKVFDRVPQDIQSFPTPCFKPLPVANQAKIRAKGGVAFDTNAASLTFSNIFPFFEASEAECLFGVGYFDIHKCNPMFFKME